MKKLAFIIIVLISNISFAQETDKIDSKTVIDIPVNFFKQMFREPDDKNLIAWHGYVKVINVISSDGDKEFVGSVAPFVDYLNNGYNEIFKRYFIFNMKDGNKQVISKDEKVWAARCGLKSNNNIYFVESTGQLIEGYPKDITSDVWSRRFSFKRSFIHPDSGERVIVEYKIEATSIYFYHLEKTDLEGDLKRNDKYNLCGNIVFKRIGPGNNNGGAVKAKVENEKYKFDKELTRGDYKVSFMWPHGDEILLDDDFVFNPTNPDMNPNFDIDIFEGEISGKVIYKGYNVPAKNYTVKLVPICQESLLLEHETKTDNDGKYSFKKIPQGEYKIVVKGAKDVDAFLTKEKIISTDDSELIPHYDIYATYNAPGFAKVKVVWRNATIKFPDEDEKIQIYDVMAARRNGDTDGQPNDIYGKPLEIPFTTLTPMGKETLYGWPESDNATPEIIEITNLGGKGVFADFRVRFDGDGLNYKSKDTYGYGDDTGALNSCDISQINNGSIYLNIGFDLTGRYAKSDIWQQVNVYSADKSEWSITRGHTPNGYPQAFKRHNFTSSQIEKFKKYEEFDIVMARDGATMKVEFKLSETEKKDGEEGFGFDDNW